MSARGEILAGATSLGIELGSTRIKACLIGEDTTTVLAVGSHDWESQLDGGNWSYSLDAVWHGIAAAYASLVDDVESRHGVRPTSFGAMGISAMMHGYLAFDSAGELLVPFRTWRNTTTSAAAGHLSDLFGLNIPLRWSVAHHYQAVLDDEPHVRNVDFLTTLAGYVHWRLTGRRVIGVGDASGMFPIDSTTADYDARLLAAYDALDGIDRPLGELLPDVLVAGVSAGSLTAAGAALLDPTGALLPGIPFCPPEGDAGTGMVATNSVSPRTGNVSAGTSIFAMIVLERELGVARRDVDLVTTPAGDAVAMVHCNNGASELQAWVRLFQDYAHAAGTPASPDSVFETLFGLAAVGDADAGGLLAYNQVAGEPRVELASGRPLVVRTPDSSFTLPNFMRSQLYGVFATLSIGMQVLLREGVALDRMFAHGGVFRTAGVAQQLLADAIGAPVAVARTASEGGAWGIAVLASYLSHSADTDLATYLNRDVFASAAVTTLAPDPSGVDGFTNYLDRYRAGLVLERAAADVISSTGHTKRNAL